MLKKRKLRSTQRAMLRRIAGPGRHPEEDYVHWIQRATRVAETKARQAKVECWLQKQLLCKWAWAGRLANMEQSRWARKTTMWRDSAWWRDQAQTSRTRPLRSRPGRFSRWEDDMCRFAEFKGLPSWQESARNQDLWQDLAQDFITFTWR